MSAHPPLTPQTSYQSFGQQHKNHLPAQETGLDMEHCNDPCRLQSVRDSPGNLRQIFATVTQSSPFNFFLLPVNHIKQYNRIWWIICFSNLLANKVVFFSDFISVKIASPVLLFTLLSICILFKISSFFCEDFPIMGRRCIFSEQLEGNHHLWNHFGNMGIFLTFFVWSPFFYPE